MAEFVVLIPLYLVLIFGLIYLGNLALCKQQVVEAARFQGWQARGIASSNSAGLKDKFFGRFSGEASINPRVKPYRFSSDKVREDLNGAGVRGSREGKNITRLLNNMDRGWLQESQVTIKFTYRPTFFTLAGLAPKQEMSSDHAIILRGTEERPTYRDRSHRHPIEELTDAAGASFHPGEDPYEKRDVKPDNRGRRSPWDVDWFKDKHPRR
jgi:hypothetical protein